VSLLRHSDVGCGVRVGHSAQSAQCPVCPETDMARHDLSSPLDAVATSREGHRSPIASLAVRHRRWDRALPRIRESRRLGTHGQERIGEHWLGRCGGGTQEGFGFIFGGRLYVDAAVRSKVWSYVPNVIPEICTRRLRRPAIADWTSHIASAPTPGVPYGTPTERKLERPLS
jgi:hypothetical protein